MSNGYGSVDRRIPVAPKNISVAEELDKVYGGTMRPLNKDKFENDVFESTLDRLSSEDRYNVNSIVRQFSCADAHCAKKIRNVSKVGMLELLAKLGIWLSAVERERP